MITLEEVAQVAVQLVVARQEEVALAGVLQEEATLEVV